MADHDFHQEFPASEPGMEPDKAPKLDSVADADQGEGQSPDLSEAQPVQTASSESGVDEATASESKVEMSDTAQPTFEPLSEEKEPDSPAEEVKGSVQSLHLQPREELGGLLAKVKAVHAKKLTIVVPERALVAQGALGLTLLAQEAERWGKEITISSDSLRVQRLARQAGLTVPSAAVGAVEHGFVPGADVTALGMESPKREAEKPPMASEAVVKSGNGWWKWGLAAAVVILLLAGSGLYAAAYYLPQATVTVFTQQRSIDRDVNVTADPNAVSVDLTSLTVPASTVTATASKTESFQATGSKDVGTSAQGTVTIANYTLADKTFPAGTKLSSGSLTFTTDSAVTVPSGTKDVIFPFSLTPGSADVDVTAASFGDNYNMPAKTTFSVSNYDSSMYLAQNKAAFSGGSKKTVTIVTAADQADAVSSIQSDVEDAANQALQQKVGTGATLLADATTTTVTSKSFDQAVGAQATTFNLTMKVSANGLTIKQSDIQSLLDSDIEKKVPDGFKLDTADSTVTNHVVSSNNDGSVAITSTYKAQILPVVDTQAMLTAIEGKDPTAVQAYLKSQPNLTGYDITISPKFPGPFYKLPSIASHIKIQVKVQK